MNERKFILVLGLICLLGLAFPACKAKSCDTDSNVADNSRPKKRVKHIGLFSKKEMRRKRW